MRKLQLLFIMSLIQVANLCAQESEIWGVSPTEGDHDSGFIYKTDQNGENLSIVFHFEGGEMGGGPYWSLTQGSDGRLFGVTADGGANDRGVLYSISPHDYQYEVLYDFVTDLPLGSITQAANGKLYGFGADGFGYLFEFDLETSEFNTIHEWDKANGRITFGDNTLLEVGENILYGVTERGGAEDQGVIFRYDIDEATYEVLYEFDRTDGYYPESLSYHSEGILYGITSWQDQRIFHFNYETNEISTVFELPGIHLPVPGILYASDGYYYGMTSTGGAEGHGSVYRVDVENQEFVTLHDFLEFTGPHIPDMPLIEGSNGKIYGNTRYVSYANAGITMIELDPATEEIRITSSQSRGLSIYGLKEIVTSCVDEETVTQWSCDSFAFDGEVLTESGNYQATFLNRHGCDSTVSLSLTIATEEECVLGASESLFSVYPNPAKEMIHVRGIEGVANFEILDMSGRTVQRGNVVDGYIRLKVETGVYLLEITSKGHTKTVRMVKE